MSDRQTPAVLARRYLDLWDRQARAMAADPDWAAVMQHWIAQQNRDSDAASQPAETNDAGD